MSSLKRHHLFEINDQEWWPSFLREKVQAFLTFFWTNKFPLIQSASPAAKVADILVDTLGHHASEYVYVDFASGAGGPTPFIERRLNDVLVKIARDPVHFVLTDLAPHIEAWEVITKKSENMHYVKYSVDATRAPRAEDLLKDIPVSQHKKVLRLFNLAFHHFEDDMAVEVLRDTLQTSAGFCIFELQAQDISSLILVTILWLISPIVTLLFFFHDPVQVMFTCLIPLIPLCIWFDGYVSCLRARTPQEIQKLLTQAVPESEVAKWSFKAGKAQHTWPLGNIDWVVCTRKEMT